MAMTINTRKQTGHKKKQNKDLKEKKEKEKENEGNGRRVRFAASVKFDENSYEEDDYASGGIVGTNSNGYFEEQDDDDYDYVEYDEKNR